MKDDLASILESIAKTQANILGRLEKLERAQGISGANELVVPGGWGYTSPTSPPSTKIAVRRGYAWTFDSFVEDHRGCTWEDFQPELSISAFSDAYYYRAVIPWIDLDTYWSPYDGFDVWESVADFKTYEECVAGFANDMQGHNISPASSVPVFPLCAIAIRNNGTTGAVNEYLPITLTDRAQSSFILRDLRPWFTPNLWS